MCAKLWHYEKYRYNLETHQQVFFTDILQDLTLAVELEWIKNHSVSIIYPNSCYKPQPQKLKHSQINSSQLFETNAEYRNLCEEIRFISSPKYLNAFLLLSVPNEQAGELLSFC